MEEAREASPSSDGVGGSAAVAAVASAAASTSRAKRARVVCFFPGKPFSHPFFWDVWSMMFIGMGLMKLRVLGAERPLRTVHRQGVDRLWRRHSGEQLYRLAYRPLQL